MAWLYKGEWSGLGLWVMQQQPGQGLTTGLSKIKTPEQTQASYSRLVCANILQPGEDGRYVRVCRPSLPGIVQLPAILAARVGRWECDQGQ